MQGVVLSVLMAFGSQGKHDATQGFRLLLTRRLWEPCAHSNGKRSEDVPLRTHEPTEPFQKSLEGCSCSWLLVFGGGDWSTHGPDADANDFVWFYAPREVDPAGRDPGLRRD